MCIELERMAERHEAEVNRLTERIEQLTHALALLSTLHPEMGIDIDCPVAMAEQIYAHVMSHYYGKE